MLQVLEKTILDYELLGRGDKILVAVSGGPDSIALLHAFVSLRDKYGWQLAAAHVNHEFRGKSAVEDSMYVEEMCRKFKVPCYVTSINVPWVIEETGLNPQEAAREVRYNYLKKIAADIGGATIATAHHADDQVETVLMRLVRGTGIEGLAGIPIWRKEGDIKIIRPLLEVTRRQIEAYCEENNLNPRHDPSNFKGKYLRNRIRLQLVPLLKEENPALTDAITHLTAVASAENTYMEQESIAAAKAIIEEENQNKMVINQNGFLAYHVALQRRMIKLILSYLSGQLGEIGFAHIEKIRELIKGDHPSARLILPHGLQVQREYHRIIFSSITESVLTSSFCYPLNIPGRTYIPEINRTFNCFYGDAKGNTGSSVAVFDPSGIKGKLYVRPRRAGDRMTIQGMNGSKKVKDIFIDEKIPRTMRDILPIVTDEQNILWIPGVKRSNECLYTAGTGPLLYVEVE